MSIHTQTHVVSVTECSALVAQRLSGYCFITQHCCMCQACSPILLPWEDQDAQGSLVTGPSLGRFILSLPLCLDTIAHVEGEGIPIESRA